MFYVLYTSHAEPKGIFGINIGSASVFTATRRNKSEIGSGIFTSGGGISRILKHLGFQSFEPEIQNGQSLFTLTVPLGAIRAQSLLLELSYLAL